MPIIPSHKEPEAIASWLDSADPVSFGEQSPTLIEDVKGLSSDITRGYGYGKDYDLAGWHQFMLNAGSKYMQTPEGVALVKEMEKKYMPSKAKKEYDTMTATQKQNMQMESSIKSQEELAKKYPEYANRMKTKGVSGDKEGMTHQKAMQAYQQNPGSVMIVTGPLNEQTTEVWPSEAKIPIDKDYYYEDPDIGVDPTKPKFTVISPDTMRQPQQGGQQDQPQQGQPPQQPPSQPTEKVRVNKANGKPGYSDVMYTDASGKQKVRRFKDADLEKALQMINNIAQ